MKNKVVLIAAQFPAIATDNTYTFSGILAKFHVEVDASGINTGISRNWNDQTKQAYRSDYENILIPVMNKCLGERKPIRDLTERDVKEVLEKLDRQRHLTKMRKMHFLHLIKCVYAAGVERGLYPGNILWTDSSAEEMILDNENDRIKAMTKIRKSFSKEEEKKLLDWFLKLDPENAEGESIGLMMMFFMGLRNNEACGADFFNFHPLAEHPEIIVFDMVKTTKIHSNDLKAGGKTSNAPRRLIVLPPLRDFISRRYDILEERVKKGSLILPDGYEDVSALPVVCSGGDVLTRSNSYVLSQAGKDLFRKINIDKGETTLLTNMLMRSELTDSEIEEKEVTTYLFRRNMATHLYNLGLSISEIQYWMGHEIEELGETRNAFSDPDTLWKISQKMMEHPFMAMLGYGDKEPCYVNKNNGYVYLEDAPGKETLLFEAPGHKYYIEISAKEPFQDLKITIDSQEPAENIFQDFIIKPDHENTGSNVNIINTTNAIYRNYGKHKT